jgi:pilus assembly protein Flp/PilA
MLKSFVSIQSYIESRKAEIEERGATAVEYGLMVGLIAVAIIGAVSFLSNSVRSTFNKTANAMNGVAS